MGGGMSWVEILTTPHRPAILGNLVRLGVALGWPVDSLAVESTATGTKLLGWKEHQPYPPTVLISHKPLVEVDVTPRHADPESDAEEDAADDEQPEEHAAKPTGRRCPECPREFETPTAAAVHAEKDHGNPKAVACDVCGAVYGTQRAASRHRTQRHSKPLPANFGPFVDRKPGPKIILACRDCEDFTTSTPSVLFEHCTNAHQRQPTAEERTPVEAA